MPNFRPRSVVRRAGGGRANPPITSTMGIAALNPSYASYMLDYALSKLTFKTFKNKSKLGISKRT